MLSTPLPLLLPRIRLFTLGTEIRARTEDRLLASQFDGQFSGYQRRVPAFIPYLEVGYAPGKVPLARLPTALIKDTP